MGCDIHLYVEKRVDGQWQAADEWFADEDDHWTIKGDGFYSGRCYSLFAILADVRNGYGFAGSPTGEGFIPIAEPRGLPDDVTKEVERCSDAWGVDGHSHSWLALRELLDYDWTRGTVRFCTINGPELQGWSIWKRKDGEMPEEYCSGVSGPGIVHVAPGELERLVKALGERAESETPPETPEPEPRASGIVGMLGLGRRYRHVEVRQLHEQLVKQELSKTYAQFGVRQPYYKCAREFWSDTIPRLLRLGSPDDVRIVFWFDN